MKKLITVLYLSLGWLNGIKAQNNGLVLNNNVYITLTNSVNLVVDNSNTNAVIVMGGGNIISEGEFNILKWNIGTSTGNYVVPFTTNSLIKIPLAVNLTSPGTSAGSIIFSTYETATDVNTAYPSDVTNMNSNCTTGNALYAIDRFWRIDAGGYTTKPTPVINFGYNDATNEIGGSNTITESMLKAQRFNSTTNLWETPTKLYGIDNPVLNTVNGVSVSPVDFFKSWTLIDTAIMSLPVGIISVNSNTICSGNTVTITPNGASTYTLLPGGLTGASFTVSPTSTTTYSIGGTNAGGCSSILASNATTTITVNSLPSLNSTQQNVSCFGQPNGSVILTPTGGTAGYTLSPLTTAGLSAGSYTYNVVDSRGCTNNTIVTISQPSTAITSLGVSSNSIACFGGTAIITTTTTGGTAPYTYVWQTNSSGTNTATYTTGTYTMSATDANNCTTSVQSFTVSQPTASVGVASIANTTVMCFGGTAIITTIITGGTAPYTYVWQTNSSGTNTATYTAGTYTMSATDANNCKTSAQSFTVSQPTASVGVTSIANTTVMCFGGTTMVTAIVNGGVPPYSYNWQASSSTTNTASYSGGTYTVMVMDGNNCASAKHTFTISDASAVLSVTELTVNTSCVTQNSGGATISVNGGTPAYTILWDNGATGSTVTNVGVGPLSAMITDARGCTTGYNTIIVSAPCSIVEIPQFFSPNGDGKNDLFFIKGVLEYPNNKMSVFNRWGSLVYQKKSYNNDWDGKANVNDALGNGLLPSGTYFIVFEFGDEAAKPYCSYVELRH